MQEIKENHTGKNIKKYFRQTLDEFKIEVERETSFYTTTDGGTDVVKSSDLLQSIHIYCMNHFLHNIITSVLFSNEKMKTIITKCSKLSRYLKSSSKAKYALLEEQKKQTIEQLKLTSFVKNKVELCK